MSGSTVTREAHGAVGAPPARVRGPRALAVPLLCALALLGFGTLAGGYPGVARACVGAAGVLLSWTLVLALSARRSGRVLEVHVALYKHHWIQACAQITVLLYWGWHVRFVYAFLPLILVQLVFAYGVESLLTWSRRDRWALGLGPFPVILSINLFLWFRLEWFHWQLALIPLGYLAKELVRWKRDGLSVHVFNPSSFPLAVCSLALLLTGASDVTLGRAIASSQFYPPAMYLVIFLAALPGQLLFGVARMTMPAVITAYLVSVVHLQVTGTYLFFDTHIPLPVFLGMHLLFTDPSTSPRSDAGRMVFGVLYGLLVAAFYVVLGASGQPTFYDKLLPVPLLNLMVRGIDRIVAGRGRRPAATRSAPAGTAPAPRPWRHLQVTSAWAVAFLALLAVRGVGDDPPGQALPFWLDTCDGGNERACAYAASMLRIYCDDGSGWACNEWGVRAPDERSSPLGAFRRACELGFEPGCRNAESVASGGGAGVRAPPAMADLPIVVRGTKPPLRGAGPDELLARACAQGWEGTCRG